MALSQHLHYHQHGLIPIACGICVGYVQYLDVELLSTKRKPGNSQSGPIDYGRIHSLRTERRKAWTRDSFELMMQRVTMSRPGPLAQNQPLRLRQRRDWTPVPLSCRGRTVALGGYNSQHRSSKLQNAAETKPARKGTTGNAPFPGDSSSGELMGAGVQTIHKNCMEWAYLRGFGTRGLDKSLPLHFQHTDGSP